MVSPILVMIMIFYVLHLLCFYEIILSVLCYVYSVIALSYFQIYHVIMSYLCISPYSVYSDNWLHTFLCLYYQIIYVVTHPISLTVSIWFYLNFGKSLWFREMPLMSLYLSFQTSFQFQMFEWARFCRNNSLMIKG